MNKYFLADLQDMLTFPIRYLLTGYTIRLADHSHEGFSSSLTYRFNYFIPYIAALIHFKLKYGTNKLVPIKGREHLSSGTHGWKYPNKVYWVERYSKRMPKIELDYSAIENVEIEGIDHSDYPKFCDAYVGRASYRGREMSERELDKLNHDGEYVHEQVYKQVY